MRIKNLFEKKIVVSLEVFPPKASSSLDTIYTMFDEIKDLNPDFISVTYGAGGSSRRYTVEIASIIKNKYNIEALAHLTGLGSSKGEIEEILKELKENNIENILALRGDLPQGTSFETIENNDFRYSKDLVQYIQRTGDFSVGGACYPEGHMECTSATKDIQYLKNKVNAGVDFLITQLFFDNDIYFNFREKLDLMDINTPISAGIMPVINKKQVDKIAELSGAYMPPKFKRMLEKYQHNPEALKEAGIAYATEQIIDLISYGIDGIHLYCMNRPEVARKVFSQISSIRRVGIND